MLEEEFYESCGQAGFTPSGAEIAFKCSLLSMLAMVDNSEPADDDNAPAAFLADQPATALIDFEPAFDSLLRVRIGEAVTTFDELKPFARTTYMNYVENPVSAFVQGSELVYVLESESGIDQSCPGAQIIFSGSIIPSCRLLQRSLDGSTADARWIWDDCTIAGGASGTIHGLRTLRNNSRYYGLTMHTNNDKLQMYFPNYDVAVYQSLVENTAPEGTTDAAGFSSVSTLVEFGFEVRFDGVKRGLGAPFSLDPKLMTTYAQSVVDKAIELARLIPLLSHARAVVCASCILVCLAIFSLHWSMLLGFVLNMLLVQMCPMLCGRTRSCLLASPDVVLATQPS